MEDDDYLPPLVGEDGEELSEPSAHWDTADPGDRAETAGAAASAGASAANASTLCRQREIQAPVFHSQ